MEEHELVYPPTWVELSGLIMSWNSKTFQFWRGYTVCVLGMYNSTQNDKEFIFKKYDQIY